MTEALCHLAALAVKWALQCLVELCIASQCYISSVEKAANERGQRSLLEQRD